MTEQATPDLMQQALLEQAKREQARRIQARQEAQQSGPWERYQAPGPWQKYARQAAIPASGGDAVDPEALAQEALRRRGATDPNALAEEALRRRGSTQPEQPTADMSFMGRLKDNVIGVDDGVLSTGETIARTLNRAGESMTVGLVGDETDARVRSAFNGRNYEDQLELNRVREQELQEEHPGLALGADIAGAVIGPGKFTAGAMRGVRGTRQVLRGAGVGATSGAVYGAMEGEDPESRAMGAVLGGTVGGIGGGVVTGFGGLFSKAAERFKGSPAAEGLTALRTAAQDLYATATQTGGTMGQGRVRALTVGVERKLQQQGYNRRLHPRISAVLDEMNDRVGNAQSLQELETLRRVASNAGQSLQPDERRLGSLVIDEIDNAVAKMGGGKEIAAARAAWAKLRRAEKVETIIEDAANSPNFETALASKFRALLRRPKDLRGFTGQERAMMKRIARGGTMGQQALKGLGDMLSPDRLSGVALTGGAALTGNPLAAAVPVAGYLSRRGAGSMVADDLARLRVGTGVQAPAPRNALAPMAVVPGVGAQWPD